MRMKPKKNNACVKQDPWVERRVIKHLKSGRTWWILGGFGVLLSSCRLVLERRKQGTAQQCATLGAELGYALSGTVQIEQPKQSGSSLSGS